MINENRKSLWKSIDLAENNEVIIRGWHQDPTRERKIVIVIACIKTLQLELFQYSQTS